MEKCNRLVQVLVTPSMYREINERVAVLANEYPEINRSAFVRMVLRAYFKTGLRNAANTNAAPNAIRATRVRMKRRG